MKLPVGVYCVDISRESTLNVTATYSRRDLRSDNETNISLIGDRVCISVVANRFQRPYATDQILLFDRAEGMYQSLAKA